MEIRTEGSAGFCFTVLEGNHGYLSTMGLFTKLQLCERHNWRVKGREVLESGVERRRTKKFSRRGQNRRKLETKVVSEWREWRGRF